MNPSNTDNQHLFQRVLDPDSRLKIVTRMGNSVEIDSNIPPRRYYRSGVEMVRMANVYLDEGSLENAFILYMKFMTLFLEKIRTHPDYKCVSTKEKALNSQKLREVLPIAENLKTRLLEQYTLEYERFQKDALRRAELDNERKRLDEEKGKISGKYGSGAQHSSGHKITPVPPLLDNLNYPNDDINLTAKPTECYVGPTFSRSTKPASLLSPTLNLPNQLRVVLVPGNLMKTFLQLSQKNTDRNIETCGILSGQLRKDQLVVTHLLIPEQVGTCDSCTTQNEEDIFDFQDQNDLITFGWIHTHPTQTAFLSSVDLHTHCSYQRMIPEAVAIVCAPRYSDNSFFCLTSNYGLEFIANCQQTGFHPHPTEPELYQMADHCKLDLSASVKVVDLRR
uniref:Putative smad6 n=3 Tax=Rhodnius prolixus TaxID=13249 RepID=A0A4P6D927_RHOPR